MTDTSGAHGSLRKEGAETPPDVSYRFVVSLGTFQAASAAWQASKAKKRHRPVVAFFARHVGRLLFGMLLLFFCFMVAVAVFHVVAAFQPRHIAGIVATITVVATIVGLVIATRILIPRWQKRQLWRSHQELCFENETLLEGRKSHLWYDDQYSAAVRPWSAFDRIVEFDEGMWLVLRQRTKFGPLRGSYVISKESLPGSCSWDEFKAYVEARLTERASPPHK